MRNKFLLLLCLFLYASDGVGQNKALNFEAGYEVAPFPGGVLSAGPVLSYPKISFGAKFLYWNWYPSARKLKANFQQHLVNAPGLRLFFRTNKDLYEKNFFKRIYWEYNISALIQTKNRKFLQEKYGLITHTYNGRTLVLIRDHKIVTPIISSISTVYYFQIRPSYPFFIKNVGRFDFSFIMGMGLITDRTKYDVKDKDLPYAEGDVLIDKGTMLLPNMGFGVNFKLGNTKVR